MDRLRLEVARRSATLGSSARRWGRRLVEVAGSPERSGRLARAGLAVVAGPVQAVGIGRARWSTVSVRGLLAQGFDGLLQLLPDGPVPALELAELRVSRELDLNLRLHGPAVRLAAVRSLAPADDSRTVEVDTVRAQHGDALWLSAVLPAALFDPPLGRYRLLVLDTDGPVRVRAGRTRLLHRWSRRVYERDQWPVRVRLDRRRRLTVTGTRPAEPTLAYAVHAAPDALTLTWTDPTTAASVVRFTHRGTGAVLVTEGSTDADGRHQVELDFEQLVDPVDDWDIEVLTTTHGPVRLRSRPGTFPSLRLVVRFPESYGGTRRAGQVWGTVRFSAGNVLVARVRPVATED